MISHFPEQSLEHKSQQRQNIAISPIITYSQAFCYLSDQQYRGEYLQIDQLTFQPEANIESIKFYDTDSEGLEIQEIRNKIDHFPKIVNQAKNKINQNKLIATVQTHGVPMSEIKGVRMPRIAGLNMLSLIACTSHEQMFAFAAKTPGFKKMILFSEDGSQVGRVTLGINFSKQIKNEDSYEQEEEQEQEQLQKSRVTKNYEAIIDKYFSDKVIPDSFGEGRYSRPVSETIQQRQQEQQSQYEPDKKKEKVENLASEKLQVRQVEKQQCNSNNQFLPEIRVEMPQNKDLSRRTPINDLYSQPEVKDKILELESKNRQFLWKNPDNTVADEEQESRIKKHSKQKTAPISTLLQQTLRNAKKQNVQSNIILQNRTGSVKIVPAEEKQSKEPQKQEKLVDVKQQKIDEVLTKPFDWYIQMLKQKEQTKEREREQVLSKQSRKFKCKPKNTEKVEIISNDLEASLHKNQSPEHYKNPLVDSQSQSALNNERKTALEKRIDILKNGNKPVSKNLDNGMPQITKRKGSRINDEKQSQYQLPNKIPKKGYVLLKKNILRKPDNIPSIPRSSTVGSQMDSKVEQSKRQNIALKSEDKIAYGEPLKVENNIKNTSILKKLKLNLNKNIFDIKLTSQQIGIERQPQQKFGKIQVLDPIYSSSRINSISNSQPKKMQQYIDHQSIHGMINPTAHTQQVQPDTNQYQLETQLIARTDSQPQDKKMDIIIRNISVNVFKKSFGQKYIQLKTNQRHYKTDKLHGSHLLWVDKAFLFQNMKGQELLTITLKNEHQKCVKSIGVAKVRLNQFLLNYKSSFLECYILSPSEQLLAVLILGYQFHKSIKQIYTQEPPRQSRSVRISPARSKANKMTNNSSYSRKKSIVQSFYEQQAVNESRSTSKREEQIPSGVQYTRMTTQPSKKVVNSHRVSTEFRRRKQC